MKIISEALIPTPCTSNHAANLLELPDGSILCTWFAGSMEGSSDISIYLSHYKDGRWGTAQKMSRDPSRSEQNPVLFLNGERELWLYYTAQLKTDQGTSVVRIRKSFDNGESWSDETDLFSAPGTFVRQTPIVNPEGALLLPVFHSNIQEAFGNDSSSVYVSRDGGESWTLHPVPGSNGCVHMNIMADCRTAYYRRRKSDFIFRSESEDGGLSWSAPKPTPLPNNNSSIQARLLPDRRIVLAFNDISASGGAGESSVPPWVQDKEAFLSKCEITERSAIWGVPRNPLVLAVSADEGIHWERVLTVESDPELRSNHDEKGAFVGDYSYPSLLAASDGRLHLAYSYLRDCIKHVTLEL